MAEEYLSVNPSDQIEAENIFASNYIIHISASIDDRIEIEANPSVKIWNENLVLMIIH